MKNITPTDDQLPATPDKPRRISKRVRSAIDALVAGDVKTISAAARSVGLSREHLSRELNKPHIAEFMRQKVVRSLSVASARAGAVKIDLLDSDNAIVRDRASSFVLGLAGIQPAATPALNVNIEVKAGYVIDLSDDPVDPKTIDHV
jgi:ribosome-binding protein aMBF1 (putative translation factor)